MTNLRDHFLLDPDVVFLNHGSFGAAPRPVLDTQEQWRRRMERQPVLFFREVGEHLAHARRRLAAFVGAPADDVAFLPNATHAVNMVLRSLDLGPEDQILTTDHEYGACVNILEFLRRRRGFELVRQPLPLPFTTKAALVEQLWQGVTPRTKVIFFSHISSSTAHIFPAAEICARAREAGILTVVDGAHAVGQIPLDLAAIGADFYTSNTHKWLMAPKGAAFLYARAERQALLEPLVVSWGWGPERSFSFGSDFLDYLQWPGTVDHTAALAVPAAIDFQQTHHWTAVRARCHALLREALPRVAAVTGVPVAYGDESYFAQMAVAPLPPIDDPAGLKTALHDEHAVEIPVTEWNGRHFVRLSIQGYNTSPDVAALINALKEVLHAFK